MKKSNKIIFNIIIIVAVIFLTIATVPKTLQEDTYYMIKVGEYVSQNGMSVIDERIEAFGWVPNLIYTYPHWLLDVIFYQLYNAFGFMGIYVFTLAVGILIYILIYYTNLKVCKNHIISAIITLISIYFLRGFIAARAQIITFLCLVLEILFIERYIETGKKRYLVGLVLDPILLANCHAALFPMYFVVFMPYLAEYALALLKRTEVYTRRVNRLEKSIAKFEEYKSYEDEGTKEFNKYAKRLEKKNAKLIITKEKLSKAELKAEKKKEINGKESKVIIEKNNRVKWLALTCLICVFTGLITPIKDIPYTYMAKSIIGNTMHFIAEHQAVALIHDYSLLVMFILAVILCFSNKIKMKLRDILMLAGMSILAIISYKQFPIYFICTMCIFNKLIIMIRDTNKQRKQKLNEELGIVPEKEEPEEMETNEEEEIEVEAEIIEEIEEEDTQDEKGKKKKTKKKRFTKRNIVKNLKNIPGKVLTVKGLVFISLIIIIFSIFQYQNILTQDFVDRKSYPVDAADWIKENLDVETMRLFNDFNYGSYLLFKDIPVFIDGRADCYDPVFNGRKDDSFLAYMTASSLQTSYETVVKDYDVTHIITTASSTLNTVLQKEEKYAEIYNDGTFVIYDVKPKKSGKK